MNYPNQQIQPIFNIVWLVFFHQQFRGSKKSECDNGMLEYQSSLYIIYHFSAAYLDVSIQLQSVQANAM